MRDYKKLLYVIIGLLVFNSCVSYRNTLLLQSIPKDSSGVDLALNYSSVGYKIQEGDFLDIRIQSPDQASLIFFNKKETSGQVSESFLYADSYVVDLEGKIYLPILGEFIVKDMTTNELRMVIKNNLLKFYKISDVSVKMMSFKVTFIGEVGNSSTISIFNMSTTMFEGLAKVGGITDFTNTRQVLLLRKYNNKKARAIKVDMNTINFVESEYYYLHPGDVIYFKPTRYKSITKNISFISLVFGVVTFMLTLVTLVKK